MMFEYPESALKAALIEALDELRARSKALAIAVSRTVDLWVWRAPAESPYAWPRADDPQESLWKAGDEPGQPSRATQVRRVQRMITALEYQETQGEHQVLIQPALLAVDDECIERAHEVNELRARVQSAFVAMEGKQGTEWHRKRGQFETKALSKHAKANSQWGRLCYAQTIRRFVVLDAAPDYIGYTWGAPRELRRTTVAEVLAAIGDDAMDSESVADRYTLSLLPPGEIVASIRSPQAKPCVNILWRGEDKDRRVLRSASLPIMIRAEGLPRFRPLPPAPQPETYRASRSDVRIEPTSLLRTRAVYRYLKA